MTEMSPSNSVDHVKGFDTCQFLTRFQKEDYDNEAGKSDVSASNICQMGSQLPLVGGQKAACPVSDGYVS